MSVADMPVIAELKNSLDQYKVIAISNVHIRQTDVERLTYLGEDPAVPMVFSRDTGGFVKLYPDTEGNKRVLEVDYPGFSEDFYNVLGKAKLAGFSMVEFDCDAEIYESFPHMDW